MLIDTHAHIYTDDFSDDRDEVIQDAIRNGIGKILMPNIDAGSLSDVLQVAEKYPGICYPMTGLHPSSVNAGYVSELDKLGQSLPEHPFAGIGEIGIDLYWDRTFEEQQKDAFRIQLQLARSARLPAVIHVRNSFSEVFSIVKEEQDGSLRGIFHCFSGSAEDARKIIDSGFLLGIGGVITYKNSHLPQVLKEIGADRLVLETDAPWLSPVPHRGKRNQCGYLIHTARKLAEILDLSEEEIAEVTTGNALELFNI
jgi:TatD DNase family protein